MRVSSSARNISAMDWITLPLADSLPQDHIRIQAWFLSRWNMEFNIGIGYWYADYDRFENRKCGLYQDSAVKHAVGLTDLGLSFIYMIR